MDFFGRRFLGRLSQQLPLADGEELLDYDVGTTRPYGLMPPPWPNQFPENGRVQIAISDRALYFRVESRSHKGEVARIPWERMATFGVDKAEGKWKRWSLKGQMFSGVPIQVSLTGRPRPTMVAALSKLIPSEDE